MENIKLVKDYKDDKFKLVYAYERNGDDVRIYKIEEQSVYAVEERTRDVRDILQVGLTKDEAIRVAYEYINGHLSYPKVNGVQSDGFVDEDEKMYYKYLQEELKEMETKIK
tara:strand:+ start:95 stop:427 length:333 start_codon:yes stop_codon:yes gene_type:complete